MSPLKSCWLVFDAEKKGSENQCRGLAEALGFKGYLLKPISRSPFLKLIPRRFCFSFLRFKKGLLQNISEENLPDFIISSGTRASVVAAHIKKKTSEKVRVINILNPRLSHDFFDLIVTPEHDRLKGHNILETVGSLHGVTPERLSQEKRRFSGEIQSDKGPVVAILLGGPSKSFKMTKRVFETLGQQVAHLHRAHQSNTPGPHFLVSFSRRTPVDFKEVFLKETKGVPLEVYDPLTYQKENPYFAYLALADHVIVSADSISMVAEACATGKPVQVVGCSKMPRKFRQFHQALEDQKSTKPFKGSLEKWDVIRLEETARVAEKIKEKLKI